MKAIGISYPFVVMDTQEGFAIDQFEREPVIGASYEIKDGVLVMTGNSNDTDCVSGVCPIK
jgi:hypothetical protein